MFKTIGFRIIAKSDGTDLYTHSSAVLDTARIINYKIDAQLDDNIIYWMCILHDLGKANPLFQSNMEKGNFDMICRHEISSLLFIDVVPSKIRKVVGLAILSHHKSILDDERGLHRLDNEYEDFRTNHIGNISVWGKDVKDYLFVHYNINIEIPTFERCVEILDEFLQISNTLEYGWSQYQGLLLQADHFASCFQEDSVRLLHLNKMFTKPILDYYNDKNPNYPLSLIESDINKRHTIVIAPTGCGKTNFMMKRCQNRVFYTLPYSASINAMYKRINSNINSNNDYYIGVQHASINSLTFIDDTTKDISKLFGTSVKVMTPHQLMSIIFRLKGYTSILMDVKGQDIILDEIHTYKEINRVAIIELIKTLKNLGCSIHICSATMPSILLNNIIEILDENETQIVKLDKQTLNTFNRHRIHLINDWDIEKIREHYCNGDKILICRNQVNAAIQTYKSLKEKFPNCKILLLHSRYKRIDKIALEQKLLNEYNSRKEPCIVVSTQVIEVSLDINFDVMFTDCADIMSLIQRFGRINRQRDNIGIIKPIYIVNLKDISERPYKKCDINKTWEVLQEYDNKILLECEMQSIIDRVHTNEDFFKAEMTSPYVDGHWKTKEFCHNPNTNLAQSLDIVGFVGILESDVETYVQTKDSSLEIPIFSSSFNGIKFSPIYLKYNSENPIAYIIPNKLYSNELGVDLTIFN